MSPPVLIYPRFGPESEFILETDASYVGLGAVLSEQQEDGKIHPIAYASLLWIVMRRSMECLSWRLLVWYGLYATFAPTPHYCFGLSIFVKSSETFRKVGPLGTNHSRNVFDT